MRILQFGKHYFPDLGGIESVIRIVTAGLNARGVPTDVLCASTNRETEVRQELGYTVTRVASYGKWASTAISPQLVRRFGQVHRTYDVIHVHMPDPLAIIAILLYRPRAKIVLHWHGDVDFDKFPWLGKLYRPLDRALARRADQVIVATRAHLEHSANRELFKGKATLIPFPLDPAFAHRARRTTSEPQSGYPRFKVFAVGRLIYYKGFEYLVEAARDLPEDCEVVIGGDGPLRVPLQRKIDALGLQTRVTLAGRLSDEQLLEAYASCDVFCLPSVSRGEMFGMVQLEAMSCGKPIVSTDIPRSGVAEVNVHNVTGIVVPIMDAKALAGAILALKEDPALRARMSEQALSRSVNVYGSDVVIPQYISLYQRLLKNGPRTKSKEAA
jgi:glycosyltransferase involved in cell wall biosynthesis